MHERGLGFGEVRVRCEGCIVFVIQNHLYFHYQRRFHKKNGKILLKQGIHA